MSTPTGQQLCRQVSAAIAKTVPPGVGSWPAAWRLVGGPDRNFCDLVDQYDAGRTDLLDAVKEAGNTLVLAWRRAVKAWRNREQ